MTLQEVFSDCAGTREGNVHLRNGELSFFEDVEADYLQLYTKKLQVHVRDAESRIVVVSVQATPHMYKAFSLDNVSDADLRSLISNYW